ncbi:Mrp/NBP35 family ATP-binding protein [Bovifimicola ammoniilytica]|jgi:Mrp family chromosome partitioning ATPase|uniref:Mrp/NBP35 family ATP-binding protein n=1 Tax=Bovifimicola ammoniilytica TaxID=2981720 RepID=UPI0008216594|nr:Mrp/NBP35 family ATP-binding protein [Bovifimicola ammoniilytica]SCJ45741.1 antiporter inner membrane protein [uncultured Eubacterium sp.]
MSDRQCNNSECTSESCAGCSSNNRMKYEPMNSRSQINKVIAVMSGKGGVGKSLVTSSLAAKLKKKGYKVGILDADITGPSIPKMFGLNETANGDGNGLYPVETSSGIKVMSVNLLLEDEEEPVIWRGPVISSVVKQFWSDVYWGELDYLLIDMPPGTGDVPLTVFQSIPVDGAIIVTSPQDLVRLIVKKAYNMVVKMDIPVMGIVENYSYIECPDCGKKIAVFGESKIDEIASEIGVELLGKLPIVPAIAKLADEGRFDEADNTFVDMAVDKIINASK